MRVLTLAMLAAFGASCGSDLAEGQTSVVLTIKNSAEAPVPVEIVIRPLVNGTAIPNGTIAVPVNKPQGSDGFLGDIVYLPPANMSIPDGGAKNEYSFSADGRAEKRPGAPTISQGSVSFEFVSGRQQRATLVLWPTASTNVDGGAMSSVDAGTRLMDAK